MAKEGPCEYCGAKGPRRAGADDGLSSDLFVCPPCWSMLQDPATALPLLRGHLTMETRQSMRPGQVKEAVDTFMEAVSGWRPRPEKS